MSSTPEVIVQLTNVGKNFGIVQALHQIDLQLRSSECVGLVGHNGAGKSTLINILAGTLTPSSGKVQLADQSPETPYNLTLAHQQGIRCVFQELSLCPNLTVSENTRVMHRSINGWGWRKKASALIITKLDEIFPKHGIQGEDLVADLSISQRQMVEIARAFSITNIDLKVVILDEPTSSLDAVVASQLMGHIRRFVHKGGTCILISHMLEEILSSCDRIVVMRDGTVVTQQQAKDFTRDSLVESMGSVARDYAVDLDANIKQQRQGTPMLSVVPKMQQDRQPFLAFKGEIVGLAGLAGQGQTDMLVQIFNPNKSMAFVAGDRQNDGVFPLWSIAENIAIGSMRRLQRLFLSDSRAAQELAAQWQKKIAIRTPDIEDNILSLSGGNQQKVLFARALGSSAQIVLMDDPMRGVDISTKQDVYDMIREEAQAGRTFIWYTTEFDELKHCDHVYVFRDANIVLDLPGQQLTEHQVIRASFAESAQ